MKSAEIDVATISALIHGIATHHYMRAWQWYSFSATARQPDGRQRDEELMSVMSSVCN